MAKTYEFKLNMDKQKRDPNIVYARVGDTESVIVRATLYDGDSAYTPTGTNAYFECVCPNGASVRQPATKSGQVVSVTLASQAFQAAGVINVAYFRFENGTVEDPTYVESTEPFVIIVLSGIDDNITAEDYIAEWRTLQDKFSEIVDFAEAAYPTIQKAVSDVTAAKQDALDAINDAKQSVEDAAQDIMAPVNNYLEQAQGQLDTAISGFKSDGQSEISAFDTNAANKIQQFETNASSKLSEYDSDVSDKLSQVDSSISAATQKINQNVSELDKATQDAIDAMEAALSENQYGELLQRLSRVWKLDNQDMVVIPNAASLNNYVAVGSYYSAESSTQTNRPDGLLAPFVMYVIKVTSTKSMQFLVPAEHEAGNDYIKLYIREIDNSTFSDWYPIGGAGGTQIDLPLSVANGGTGATTAAQARRNIGAGTSDFSGDYNDLQNKPTIPSFPLSVQNGGTGATTAAQARQNIGAGTSNFSGNYNDLTDKPDIPEQIATPVSISNGGTGATTATQARRNIGAGTSNFSGNYDDLTNKPDIPTVPVSIANGGTGATSVNAARDNLDAAKGDVTSTYLNLTGSNKVTSSLTDSVHTEFTLDQLLTWLKDQGLGGNQDGIVAGVIYPYTGSAIPNGFLLCNGAAVSRTKYAKLFDAIGTTYGAGDGRTTFNLPNLKQRMLIGSGDGMSTGSMGGSNTHQHEYGVTFGEYYSGIVKPLRTYDYSTSAASDNVVQLGNTPDGTTVNTGTQEENRNPPSLPFEYVAYGKTKESSSLPRYLVVNYIISTGDVDATARSDGFSTQDPITIENGGTSATSQKAAEYNVVKPTSVNGTPTMDDEVVFVNGSASSSRGRLSSYKLRNAYVPIFSQLTSEIFTGSGGTLPVASGGTGVTSIGALRSSLKLYAGSKVINNGDAYSVLFSNSEYAGITGRGFNNGTDCVLVMNGDADATQTEFYCTTWKASTGNIGVFCGSAGVRRVNYFIIAP